MKKKTIKQKLDVRADNIEYWIWAGYTFKAISKKFECPISPFMNWLLIVK